MELRNRTACPSSNMHLRTWHHHRDSAFKKKTKAGSMGTLPEDSALTVKEVGEGKEFIGLPGLLMENYAISVTMKVVHVLYASFVYGIFCLYG